jgi:hypothetical protein
MGPILIFDKSLLESLNSDEAVWLDQFFLSNITPIFFIETLADLEKEVRRGRTPEQVVGSLAHRTPDLHARPNVHHRNLLVGELSGAGTFAMDGRIIVPGGRPVELKGKKGTVYMQSPEEEALARWQRGDFVELERLRAKAWRAELSQIDPEQQRALFRPWVRGSRRPKTLADAKVLADTIIDEKDRAETLQLGLAIIGLSGAAHDEVMARWRIAGGPPLRAFAPYFRHVFGADLFFYLALAADLISLRPTNMVDLAYLYYMPFCMVFTSSDKLHERIVPVFLRDDQSFVRGTDLKADLHKLDEHFSALPQEVKDRGLYHFAARPPLDISFLVTRLWDRHLRPIWREDRRQDNQDPERDAKTIRYVKRLAEATAAPGSPRPDDSDKLDYLIVKRRVITRKGKWKRFPPEVDRAEGGE